MPESTRKEEFKDCGRGRLFLMAMESLKKENYEPKSLESSLQGMEQNSGISYDWGKESYVL